MITWSLLTIDQALRASWAADTCSPDDLERHGCSRTTPHWVTATSLP